MIRRSGDWLTNDLGDALMMMNIDRGTYIGMNAVGARIWELIETPRDIGDLCDELVVEFEIDAATCRNDVEIFVQKLEQHGLASVTPG